MKNGCGLGISFANVSIASPAIIGLIIVAPYSLPLFPHLLHTMSSFTRHLCISLFLASFFVLGFTRADTPTSDSVDFGRDVRPILSDHCFACHGPDEEERMAGLRLDSADGILDAVEPGEVEASELIERIVTDDPDVVMPPPEYGKPLSRKQIETLKNWIDDGAEYQDHWAFTVPVKQGTANTSLKSATEAINYFIDRQVNAVGLIPNAEADRRTLLRRVCLDLTGLPPTKEQLKSFLTDQSPGAYERLVDRLLQTPAFGEHIGRYWLDVVRYADTHGLHLDNYREMWLYRDWVINAFNANMPMDQFVTEQLAGDLIPNATVDQQIASGFNRLNVTTNEGGSIYDEVFARNVMDRTDAFGTIFLGLTTGCAVCHDHKFDPITMHDYYSLSAFFNSLDGRAMDGNIKDHPPVLAVPSQEQKKQIDQLQASLDDLRREIRGPIEAVDKAQREWEDRIIRDVKPVTSVLHPASIESEAGVEMKITDDHCVEVASKAAAKDVTTILARIPTGQSWRTVHLEAVVRDDKERVGLSSNGNVVLSEIKIEVNENPKTDQWKEVKVLSGVADVVQDKFDLADAFDDKIDSNLGWAVAGFDKLGPRNAWLTIPPLETKSKQAMLRFQLAYKSGYAAHQFRRIRLSLSTGSPDASVAQPIEFGVVHAAGPFPIANANSGYSRSIASQGKPFDADETFKYEDREYRWQQLGDIGQVEVYSLPTVKDRSSAILLHQNIVSPEKQKISLLFDTSDGHIIYLNGKKVRERKGPRKINPLSARYELDLKKGNNRLYVKVVNHSAPSLMSYAYQASGVKVPKRLVELLKKKPKDRTSEDQKSLQKYYRIVHCSHPDWLALKQEEKATTKLLEETKASVPTTLVWKETTEPRKAHILLRGQYENPGEVVSRDTPEFLPSMDESLPKSRLGLAQWLLSDDHPLTSRVMVNRFWQQCFGEGLVKTSEDFGSQGQPPSHPDLLDWLAIDFRENNWDVKRLLKSIVMSKPYKRSAKIAQRQLEMDPDNRLLARGPRHRLDAEVLRDQSLAISGLLVDRQGGPGVKPPQPKGLWYAVAYTRSNTANFEADKDENVYRRSVYIFWKRTSAPPQMSTFDAPSRESCTARRERTNTPLQALLLMNETQYLESARHFATRSLEQSELETPAQRISWMFETATARVPSKEEVAELVLLAEDLSKHYAANPSEANELAGSSAVEKAVWTMVASTILNLDEVVTK